MSIALLFPGQGSQAVGMGQSLAANFASAREVFQEVDDALGFKLSQIIAEGPEADLTRTENTQPAIMAVSMATFRVMEREMGFVLPGSAAYVAGHSLGEYTALTAAGSLTLSQSAKLLKIRGSAMQAAVPEGKGAMAALIGPELEAVQAIVKETKGQLAGEVIEVANHNAPNQIVISGTARGVERAMELAKERGAKRAVLLQVSAPFHCSMMAPAALAMKAALAETELKAPAVPLIANVTAEMVTDAGFIKELLVAQVTGTVRWVDSVLALKALGVTRVIEIGHGQVLSGLVKRIAPEITVTNIATPEDLDSYHKAA